MNLNVWGDFQICIGVPLTTTAEDIMQIIEIYSFQVLTTFTLETRRWKDICTEQINLAQTWKVISRKVTPAKP